MLWNKRNIILAIFLALIALIVISNVRAQDMRMVGSLGLHPSIPADELPSFLIGDDISRDAQDNVRITGNAEVRRLDAVVKGDDILYNANTGIVNVTGNGLLMRDGSIVKGPHLRFNVDDDTGNIKEPKFWLGGSAGRGHASEAEMFDRNHMRLYDVQYSGCDCLDPAWYIESTRVDTYDKENEGVARNGVLYFKGMPILYSPYLTFPLRNERKSGFLLPTYGSSSNSGFELTTPYYLNLAPNYDATLYPRYMSKRGLLMGAEFRHLGQNSESTLFGTYNMHDSLTGDKRWLYSILHDQNLGRGFRAYIDARGVSDDDYFRDYSSFGLADAAITYVPTDARLSWSGYKYFDSMIRVYKYQTLQDKTGGFLIPPYNKLPEITLNARRYGWHGFDVVSENTFTRFIRPLYNGDIPDFQGMVGRRLGPNGNRLTSYNHISYPMVASWGYLTPRFGVHMSHYETEWFANDVPVYRGLATKDLPASVSRVVPISSIDAGLNFERNTTFFGNAAIQTLEPRLYYLYVPYRYQDDIPVYDTGLASFSYQQAFEENIFSGGWDRIANANQLTVGLTSRWLDADSGFERMSLSAAQRFYFTDQLVGLTANEDKRINTESDYLLDGKVALTDKFNLYTSAQLNHDNFQANRLSSGVRWNPKRLAAIALSYRYERYPNRYYDSFVNMPDDILSKENVSLTAQWPFSIRWYGVGRIDYSLSEKRSTQSIVGLEYRGDGGWAARFVLQRYAVSVGDSNTAAFMQLELSGLGAIGNDPMSVLSDRITGYQTVSTPLPEKTIFERYE